MEKNNNNKINGEASCTCMDVSFLDPSDRTPLKDKRKSPVILHAPTPPAPKEVDNQNTMPQRQSQKQYLPLTSIRQLAELVNSFKNLQVNENYILTLSSVTAGNAGVAGVQLCAGYLSKYCSPYPSSCPTP